MGRRPAAPQARGRPPDFRIEAYLGHGGPHGVVVRGRVLDDPPPTEAVEGEGVGGGAAPDAAAAS